MILNEDAIFSKTCKNPVYIVLMNGKSPLSSIILSATGDYFSHACIAFNDSLDPLYSFGSKSKTIQKGGMGFCVSKPTDLTVFNKQAYYAVYVTYVTDEAYAKMKERLSYFTKNAGKMIYDYIGLLNVWMHQSSDHRTRAYFCSRFVMDVIGAGIKIDKLPSLYRPQDIANMDNITLVNRGYDFHNYDKKITQKNEKLLKKGKLNTDDIIFEDVSSVLQKDFQSKHDMNLSSFEKMRLSDAAIQVYGRKIQSLSHVRVNNNTKGYIWIDKKTDMPVAIVNVEEKDDGFSWIQAFEIFVPYKGHGLSKDILNVAIRDLKATNLSVSKDNQVAIKIYKSYGFKTYKTTENMYFMSIDKNAFDDEDDYEESALVEEAFEIQGETGFYDRHNRWNPMVIINGENYRHRVECLIMCQNKLFVAESNDGNLLVPGGGVDKSLSDEEQVYNECKEEARILVKDIKPTGYSYIRRTGVSQSARNLPKEQQWVGSYTEVYIANYMKDFTGFIDYCDRDSEMIRGRFRVLSDIGNRLLPEWKAALMDANYISVATESIKSYKDPRLALKRRMGRKRNNAIKLGDFSGVVKAAPTPQAQTVSVPSPAVSSSAPSNSAPAKQENTEDIPDNIKENANRLLCKEIAAYPKYSGHYYNMDYPLYNGQGHAIVGWKMTGVHYNDFESFNRYRDHIYEYCSKIFSDTNPGYKLNMDKKTNCIYISEV